MYTMAEMLARHLKSDKKITEREYFEAFGQFIDAYAKAEGMTHAFFIHVSRIPSNIAQAITGDMSHRDLVAPIKKIAKINNLSANDIKEINTIFQQFNHIAQFRHRLIHRSADLHEGQLISTNRFSMKALEDFEVLTFSPEDLDDATYDLRFILLRLYNLMKPAKAIQDEEILAAMRKPWRYKPLKPETPHRPPRPKSQPHKRQRRASRV